MEGSQVLGEARQALLRQVRAALALLASPSPTERVEGLAHLRASLVQLQLQVRESGEGDGFHLSVARDVAKLLKAKELHAFAVEWHEEWLARAEAAEDEDMEELKEALYSCAQVCSLTSSFERARQLFSRLKALAKDVPVLEAITITHGEANNELRCGDYSAALQGHQECLKLVESYEDTSKPHALVQVIYAGIGNALYKMGLFDQALEWRFKALDSAETTGNYIERVRSLGNVSETLRRLHRLHEALEFSDRSLTLLRHSPTGINILNLLLTELSNRATLLLDCRKFDEGLALVNESQQLLRRYEPSILESTKLGMAIMFASVYQRAGKIQEALGIFNDVLQRATDSGSTLQACAGIAEIFLKMGYFEAAMLFAQRSISMDTRPHEKAHLIVGLVALRLGKKETALHHCQQYLLANENSGLLSNIVSAKNAMAAYYIEAADFYPALSLAEECLNISTTTGSLIGQAVAHGTKVRALTALGNFEAGLAASEACIVACEQLRDFDALSRAYSNLGRLYSKMGKISEAVNALERAITILEKIGSELTSDLLTASYNQSAASLYSDLIEGYVIYGDYEMALFTSERGRCKGFLKLLSSVENPMVPPTFDYEDMRQAFESNISEEGQRARCDRLNTLWNAVRSLDVPILEYHVRKDDMNMDCWLLLPRSEETPVIQHACCSVASVSEGTRFSDLTELTAHTLSVIGLGDWFFSDPADKTIETAQELQRLGIIVSANGARAKYNLSAGVPNPGRMNDTTELHATPLPSLPNAFMRSTTGRLAEVSSNWESNWTECDSSSDEDDVRADTQSFDPTSSQPADCPEAMQRVKTGCCLLFRLLLSHFKDALQELPQDQEILIVPHRAVATIPFAALQDPETDLFMVERFAFSYSPAVMVSAELQRRKQNRSPGPTLVQKCVILGKPNFHKQKDLPQVKKEVTALKSYLHKKHRVTARLTITPTVQQALNCLEDESVDIVHIASHGSMYGNIVLGHSEHRGIDDDLTRHHIYASPTAINPVMVVLNTCLGASGEISADGTEGIVRALLGRGCTSVLCCLASESDTSAKRVVQTLYCRLLEDRLSTAQALALAQRVEMSRTAGSRYKVRRWAPFAFYGYSVTFLTPETQLGIPAVPGSA